METTKVKIRMLSTVLSLMGGGGSAHEEAVDKGILQGVLLGLMYGGFSLSEAMQIVYELSRDNDEITDLIPDLLMEDWVEAKIAYDWKIAELKKG